MRSAVGVRVSRRARRASESPAGQALARAGLTARGVLYILIGWVAVLVALGQGRQQADQQGALQLLAGTPFGQVSLWLIGIGFAAYALWRLSEAAFGVTGEGKGALPRLKSLARAVVYAAFAYLTFSIINGSQGNETRQQQDLTATLLRHPGGQWVVGIAGLVVVAIGLLLVAEGLRRKFLTHLRLSQMSTRTRRVVTRLGVAGTTARGAVFAIAGALVVDAAVTHRPGKSGGLDKALLTLRHQPFGEFLLAVAALGLVVFGIYGLCEARWRRV
ncbi:MAG TPA: DUF1206 domain-containing protein [Streptosporangiaceae bacterium]|nr:DUF1206 domain-containing protein [Streptosporangiaceae bacterium]